MNQQAESPMILTAGLIRIHKVMTRALKVMQTYGARYAESGFPGPAIRIGFVTYGRCLVSLFETHHDGEEKVMFPDAQKLGVPLDVALLVDQHKTMIPHSETILELLEEIDHAPLDAQWQLLLDTLAAMNAEWAQHVIDEEAAFSDAALRDKLTVRQDKALLDKIERHGRFRSGPLALMIPFIMYNLEGPDREAFLENVPGPVASFLVPVVWKRRWQVMSPFLLDVS